MSLRSVNLNLIPILQAILRERNLSRAADAVGLTQPAISGALTRLRAVLSDPLLVRNGRNMELTLRAQELIGPVEEICKQIEDLMAREQFDPLHSERRFVIASADYAVLTIGPMIERLLQQLAPKASVHFVDIPHRSLQPHANEIDFFIVPELMFRNGPYPPMRHVMLIEDEFVTVVAKSHPLSRVAEPSAADLLALRYAIYYPALSTLDHGMLSAVSGPAPQGRQVVTQVQQFSLLPVMVVETGCAAVVPRRIASYMQRFMPIHVIDDGPLPLRLDLSLAWNAGSDSDMSHRWFRDLLIGQCALLRPVDAGRA